MKKSFREKPTRHIAALLHDVHPTPLAVVLICLFSAAVQAEGNLPPLQIDPGLLPSAPAAAKQAPVKPATQPVVENNTPAKTQQQQPVEKTPAPVVAAPEPQSPVAQSVAAAPRPDNRQTPATAPAKKQEEEPQQARNTLTASETKEAAPLPAEEKTPTPDKTTSESKFPPAQPVAAASLPDKPPASPAIAPAKAAENKPQPARNTIAASETMAFASTSESKPLNLPLLQVDPGLLPSTTSGAMAQASESKTIASTAPGLAKEATETDQAVQMAGNEVESGEFVPLKPSQNLTLSPPPGTQSTPIFISAMLIQGHQDAETEAIDDAELRQWGQVVTADRLRYSKPEDELHAVGNVRIDQKGDVTEGPELKMQMERKEGFMQQPVFQLNQQIPPGRGDAKMLLFEGENQYRLEDARYTTCQAGSDDWFIHAHDLEIDRTTQVGTARNAYVEFMDVPFLYTPWMNFALNSDRKSGFLSPSFGSTGSSGAEFALPYYWNIAPNMDATITPRVMTKRGTLLQTDFRYLERSYAGEASVETLPNDKIAGINRSFMSLHHRYNPGNGWAGSLNLERASDDNYFRDLSTQVSVTSQANLLRDALLSYTGAYAGGALAFSARSQSYQTLQDPLAPIDTPYRSTQMLLNGAKMFNWQGNTLGPGVNFTLNSELVDFTHPTKLSGTRSTLYPSISLPMTRFYGFITPKIGLHSTNYSFSDNNATLQPNVSRNLPIFSVDSGLYFERDLGLFGSNYQQTLEPRLYYVRTPFRDQSNIPVFDTGDAGFGIPQIFSENRFSGSDRISDANQVTLGVTSRFLEESGIERLRSTVAQRYYLTLPEVTLPGTTAPTRKYSDMLVSVGGRVTRALTLDSLWQYDPDLKKTNSLALTSRYMPTEGKVFNASYRYAPATATIPTNKQIDASTQWPLTGRWSGLARWNYSILDKKALESLGGVEYNAGCWAFRAVLHSFATATSENSNSIFFQLELNGVSSIGSNPLDVLKRNIYGYSQMTDIPHENSFSEIR
ncbi:MAG: LPS assembly protein LptD [Sulfuricella sp.]|nr:LPS assembly protein LptD [Sulfuricella sp.]